VNAVFIGASNELGEFESGTMLGGPANMLVAATWT
jgi:hypothetical protein